MARGVVVVVVVVVVVHDDDDDDDDDDNVLDLVGQGARLLDLNPKPQTLILLNRVCDSWRVSLWACGSGACASNRVMTRRRRMSFATSL
jgi:hypothetical protein